VLKIADIVVSEMLCIIVGIGVDKRDFRVDSGISLHHSMTVNILVSWSH
jgi:hypothetical protein